MHYLEFQENLFLKKSGSFCRGVTIADNSTNYDFSADDIQIYGHCTPSSADLLSTRLSLCLDDIIFWCSSNRLLLNAEKSEFLWFSSKARKNLPPSSIRIGTSFVTPALSARCLGVHIDSHLSFKTHVSKCVSACFCALRQIRSVSRYVPRPLLRTLVTSLVISRLDYCLSALYGITSVQTQRLQSVLNASARLIFSTNRFAPVSPLLRALKWLPIKLRIDFRLALIAHSCRLRLAPDYLVSEVQDVASVAGRRHLRSSDSSSVLVPFVRRPTLGGRSFSVAASRAWNSLPPHLRTIDNPRSFKKQLKAHFLKLYSC